MTSNGTFDEESVNFHSVPIVDVTKENLLALEPTIRLAVESCDFIAIDCELSGLGDRKKLNAPSIEDRYFNSSIVAKTRSIIALGLSIFKEGSGGKDGDFQIASKRYQAQTYNIVVLCSEDYIVEPGSVNFLVKHGFNFNQQYSHGVPYYRGNDRDKSSVEENRLRNIFADIVRSKKKVVFHNGLVDIVFLYQNLYAQLPQTLPAFLADLCEMFPNGIYDTKYIAEYIYRLTSTFLEFVFKKLYKINRNRCSKLLPNVEITFPHYPHNYKCVEYIRCAPNNDYVGENKVVCQAFANHGNCQSKDCSKSHDVDYILAAEDKKSNKKKRREKETNEDSIKSREDEPREDLLVGQLDTSIKSTSEKNRVTGHRAGMDAFMTGYSFAAFTWHKTKIVDDNVMVPSEVHTETLANNMYLVAKEFPLLIRKNNFAKNSSSHAEKYEKIMKPNDAI